MRKIYLLSFILVAALNANSQFVTKPLNYQVSGDHYYPIMISPVDVDHVWLGTYYYSSDWVIDKYSYAVHTNDGGETWIFDSIPAPGLPFMSNVCALDENTCYYTFIDNWADGSIWKTTDGGTTWTQKTTTEFQGGFADFFHAFNSNEGVAVGDPNGGYWEIYRTNDGGDTWARIDQANIPSILEGEAGFTDCFSTDGDNIWFTTNMSRVYKSIDQGQNWTVSAVPTGTTGEYSNVAFSSPLDGMFFGLGSRSQFYRTSDGGSTWAIDSLPHGDVVWNADGVNGLDKGLVIASWDSLTDFVKVYFTPDFFSTLVVLDSNLIANANGIKFSSPESGWLCGYANDTNDILKFTGVLTTVHEAVKAPENLSIMPNPSSADALVKIPASLDSKSFQLRILDMNGRELEQRPIASSTGWTKLNSSMFGNGIYLVEIIAENKIVARERWVVSH